jgi:metallo-beta-lactamase class B
MKRLTAIVCAALLVPAAWAFDKTSWSQPQQPFRIYGNTWYVGTKGLSAILITSPQGHVLLDSTLADNLPQIEANIRALGFRVEDIRAILNSHAHPDHAGGIQALAEASGATVYASREGAKAMMAGGDDPTDPQYGESPRYTPVKRVEPVADGGVVRVGELAVTAHYTPGHTPGSTSWTWRACEQQRCLDIAYADSVTPISRDGFRYSDEDGQPGRAKDFRRSLAVVAKLPCDVLITPHPDASDVLERAARRDQGVTQNPLVDAGACRAYAARGTAKLDERLAKERHSP